MSDTALSGKTIAVILGAQAWPLMADLRPSDAFELSARGFRDYLHSKEGLNLPEDAVKWLFDSIAPKDDIDHEIDTFLRHHHVGEAPGFDNLIVYYTGHGDFTRGDQNFQMILRSTRQNNADFSGYQMRQLATTVNRAARAVRKVVILDCCYAAAAFGPWQFQSEASVKSKIGREAEEQFATPSHNQNERLSGTALICACDDEQWALYKDGKPTMFSGGLLQALKEGDAKLARRYLGIDDVYALARAHIVGLHGRDAVAPVLHVPKGQAELVLSAPLFPNPASRLEPTPSPSLTVSFKLDREGSPEYYKYNKLRHYTIFCELCDVPSTVDAVTFTLHSSFDPRRRKAKRRPHGRFRIRITTYGNFKLKAEFKTDRPVILTCDIARSLEAWSRGSSAAATAQVEKAIREISKN